MSVALTRKGTWALIGVAAFVAGAAVVRFTGREPRVVLANLPPHDVVSRALDSEMEVSPALAAQRDGSLAVAWLALWGGKGGDTRYIGVRVSEPNAGKLGPLLRIAAGPDDAIANPDVVPLGQDEFLVTFLELGGVTGTRVSRNGLGPSAHIGESARSARAATTPNGTVLVAWDFKRAAGEGITLSTSRDGTTFTRKDIASERGELLAVCGDDHAALVVALDEKRGVVVHQVPLDPEGPVSTSTVSALGEHVAKTRPACFVNGQDAFVVYALTDKPQDAAESVIADSLVFARSKDGGKNFLQRVPHRPPSHVLNPTFAHANNAFTLLGVMGSGAGDVHASASVITLSADGRSQNGLTRTVIAPVTMATGDASGWMGDSLGLVDVSGVTWTAVVDNASGESHVALVHVL